MKTRKAIYAASLDPITNGHINVIERMAPLYDELVIIIAVDSRKKYTFSTDERVEMAKYATTHIKNVTVSVCVGQYVVRCADSIGAQVIIRGIRNNKYLDDEQILAEENRKICPNIETIFVPCLSSLMYVSSSVAKGHVGVDPDWEHQVARLVPVHVILKLKMKFILEKARKHWESLMRAFGNPINSEKVFLSLVKRYSEAHRAYHTLEHVVSMLDEFEEIKDQAKNPEALKLAIWYHDAIYDPEHKDHHVVADNEARSAYNAELDMKELGLSASIITLISGTYDTGLISATTHTQLTSDNDAQILVDLDLAVLGRKEVEFDIYEEGIRKEYNFVPDADFRAGRSKILQSFLDRSSIYQTKYFMDKYESIARKNLQRSIEQLKK